MSRKQGQGRFVCVVAVNGVSAVRESAEGVPFRAPPSAGAGVLYAREGWGLASVVGQRRALVPSVSGEMAGAMVMM